MRDPAGARPIDPITGQPFNVIAYIPALGLALMLAAGWATLKSDVHAATLRHDALFARVVETERRTQSDDIRIRALETGVGRLEERLVSIGEGIIRIEQRLGGER